MGRRRCSAWWLSCFALAVAIVADDLALSSGVPPSLTGVLGSLPPSKPHTLEHTVGLTRRLQAGATKTLRVALCIAGHLRSFVLPGVYSGIYKHILTAPGIDAGVFMVAHLYNQCSSDFCRGAPKMQVDSQAHPNMKEAELLFKPYMKHYEITVGSDCNSLKSSWASSPTGLYNSRTWHCWNDGGYLQIMWLDRAIQEAMHGKFFFDVMLRMRPDVGVFAPIAWTQVSRTAVNFMPKDAGGKSDWFFAAPHSLVHSWWDEIIVPGYKSRILGGCCPDYVIFDRGQGLHQMDFPVAIVRDAGTADCFRLVTSTPLRQECFQDSRSGFFDRLQPDVAVATTTVITRTVITTTRTSTTRTTRPRKIAKVFAPSSSSTTTSTETATSITSTTTDVRVASHAFGHRRLGHPAILALLSWWTSSAPDACMWRVAT